MAYFPGLGTHFNARVDLPTLEHIRAFGFREARMDAMACDHTTMLEMWKDCWAADLRPLPIVYDVERLNLLPVGDTDVEWGNEPDGDILPSTYRAHLDEACKLAAKKGGLRLWAPAISNLDRDSLKWLELVRGAGWPKGMHGVSVHRYGDGTFEFAHDGFADRDDEVLALLELCDGLPFICTEFGYPTGTARSGAKREKFLQAGLNLSEARAAVNITKEWEFWRHYTDKPFLYQINDGQEDYEKYGIRRFPWDLNQWKPSAYTVPQEASMIALTNATLFGPIPITGWLTGDLEGDAVKLRFPLPGGDGGGRYLSIQPGAEYEGRTTPGGAYETFSKQGSDLVCHYIHEGVEYVHVVPFKELP
jgi:hypothetical protein